MRQSQAIKHWHDLGVKSPSSWAEEKTNVAVNIIPSQGGLHFVSQAGVEYEQHRGREPAHHA
jgi:hypothetical protein